MDRGRCRRRPRSASAPLEIRANPMLGRYAATVCCIVHDEMFFLPAFLAHYRRLGADRFVILDDRSTDGTAAFLAAQPDVMVVGSAIRYFAAGRLSAGDARAVRETRAVRLWRDQMLDQFCAGQWAVVVDPDEFLALPTGPAALTAALAAEGAEAAWGVMVDMYPRTGARHPRSPDAARFRLEDAWYFDARPHLDPRQARETAAGAAHRLSGQRGAALRHLGGPAAGHAGPAAPPAALRLPLRSAPA